MSKKRLFNKASTFTNDAKAIAKEHAKLLEKSMDKWVKKFDIRDLHYVLQSNLSWMLTTRLLRDR